MCWKASFEQKITKKLSTSSQAPSQNCLKTRVCVQTWKAYRKGTLRCVSAASMIMTTACWEQQVWVHVHIAYDIQIQLNTDVTIEIELMCGDGCSKFCKYYWCPCISSMTSVHLWWLHVRVIIWLVYLQSRIFREELQGGFLEVFYLRFEQCSINFRKCSRKILLILLKGA